MSDSFNPPKNLTKSSHYPVLEIQKMKLHEVEELTKATDRGHLDLASHCISADQCTASPTINTQQIQAE